MKKPRQGRFAFLLLMATSFLAAPASAAGTGGCESFAWPLAVELSWMKRDDASPVVTGSKLDLPPDHALAVMMSPISDVGLQAPASGKPKAAPEKELGAVIFFERTNEAGIHQVTLSNGAWIDVIQNGKILPAIEHTGKTDCDVIRKSVRFDLAKGPFAIQITGASEPALKLIVRKAS